jgi:predicted membrane protein (TIGR00267 family)
MYRARGYTDREIEVMVNRLMSDKKILLEDMAHKELGFCPATLEEPVGNALVMGISYIVGGSIPLLPYFALPVATAVPLSVVGTLLALFVFGGAKGRLVGQTWWRSGLEMLGIAGIAAFAGFIIGRFAKILF